MHNHGKQNGSRRHLGDIPREDLEATVRDLRRELEEVRRTNRTLRQAQANMTSRQESQHRLQQQEERLRLALENAQMGLWDITLTDSKTVWNGILYDLLGHPRDHAVTSETMFSYTHGRDRERLRQRFRQWLESGRIFKDEFRVVRPNGQVRWLATAGRLYRDEDGHPVRAVGVTYDVTDRRRMSEELADLNRKLEDRVIERTAEAERRADQLRALTAQLTEAEDQERQRIAEVLHDDLQQLLALLRIKVGMMVREEASESSLAEDATELEDLIDRCIEKTRRLSRELSPTALRMHGLVKAVQWLAQDLGRERGLTVTVDSTPDAEPESPAVASILYRAVKELLYNVIKHSGEDEARVTLYRRDGNLEVTVCDDGQGFDPEAVKAKRESCTAFGLMSIEERLGFLGGSLKLDGGIAQGCCVRLTVPAEATMGRPAAASSSSKDVSQALNSQPVTPAVADDADGRTRILLVDDHDVMRQALAAMLAEEETFHVVAQGSNGVEGVCLARALEPDIIIMDISMPEMNGVEATIAIRETLPKPVIIGLSMHGDSHTEARMLDAGADRFLCKSGSLDDLREVILDAAQKRREATAGAAPRTTARKDDPSRP